MKIILLFWLVVMNFFLFSLPAQASICRIYNNDEVCILSIKRSAKYYWRYRTEISINGKKKIQRIYDCRRHNIIEKNSSIIPFSKDGIENFICQTLNK